MFVVAVILTIVLTMAMAGVGSAKVTDAPQSLEIRDRLGLTEQLWKAVGVLELLGALGLVVGLFFPVIGIASAIAIALLMACAVIVHIRAGEPLESMPAFLLFAFAVVTAVVRALSM